MRFDCKYSDKMRIRLGPTKDVDKIVIGLFLTKNMSFDGSIEETNTKMKSTRTREDGLSFPTHFFTFYAVYTNEKASTKMRFTKLWGGHF